MPKTKVQRREFLQLAKAYDPDNHDSSGWYISEKLDGQRCFWDGGISRGKFTENVPYASIHNPKTGEIKNKIDPVATGLWSRYGNPIIAPDWFLDQLPPCPLDGELWAGRGKFQLTSSIVRRDTPDDRWGQVQFACYGSPHVETVFGEGEIKNANFHRTFGDGVLQWVYERIDENPDYQYIVGDFAREYDFLGEMLEGCGVAHQHPQRKLADTSDEAHKQVETYLQHVLDQGGEGVIIRDPDAVWTPKRVASLLKYKPYHDDEAVVVGFVAGRVGKQGNVHGKIGALIVVWNAVPFELGTGLTMDEREFGEGNAVGWANEHPGEELPPRYAHSKHFNVGDVVGFKYRELTDDGVPKEARFWRKRGDV